MKGKPLYKLFQRGSLLVDMSNRVYDLTNGIRIQIDGPIHQGIGLVLWLELHRLCPRLRNR